MIYGNTVLSIAPIFLLLVVGYFLRRGAFFSSAEFWDATDKLVYWVLFPALLFAKTSTTALVGEGILANTAVIYGGFGSAVLFALIVSKLFRFNGPVATSVLQGCARHNAFIALAVAERLFGEAGLTQAALVTAMLIPITNIVVVTLMVILLQGRGQKGVVGAIVRDLIRNPLLIAVVLGIGLNLLGVTPIIVVTDLMDILGRAALPIMLISVGASIQIEDVVKVNLATFLSIVGKMVVFPFVIVILAMGLGLSPLATMVAAIFGAVPTAASAYTLARQMGGDAPLMSTMTTVQTAVSFLLLPLTIVLVQRLIG